MFECFWMLCGLFIHAISSAHNTHTHIAKLSVIKVKWKEKYAHIYTHNIDKWSKHFVCTQIARWIVWVCVCLFMHTVSMDDLIKCKAVTLAQNLYRQFLSIQKIRNHFSKAVTRLILFFYLALLFNLFLPPYLIVEDARIK